MTASIAIPNTKARTTSIRLQPHLQEALNALAKLTGECPTEIIYVALARYLKLC